MLELYHNDLPVSIQEVKNLNISLNYNILSFDTCVIKSNTLIILHILNVIQAYELLLSDGFPLQHYVVSCAYSVLCSTAIVRTSP
jgi:hypothetical protein